MMMGAARLPKMAPIPRPVRRRRLLLRVRRFLAPPNVLRPPLGRRWVVVKGPNFKDLGI